MKRISIATGELQGYYGDKEALRIAKEAGADAVDFCLEDFCGRYDFRNADSVYAKSKEEIYGYFSDIKRYADELGLEICQTHGRGYGFMAKRPDDDALLHNAEIDFFVTSILKAPVCIVHAVTTMFHPDAEPQYMRDLNFDMYNKMISLAKRYGVKIATETFGDALGGKCCDFFGNINEFIDSYERICAYGDNADWLTVCVDTGHTNKASRFNNNPLPDTAIRMLGSRVTCLHLNDNNKMTDQHLIPYVEKRGAAIDGVIDWDSVFDALDDIGYNGVYNLELSISRYGLEVMPEFCRFAIAVLRNALDKREKR